jgi:hypothetical protein
MRAQVQHHNVLHQFGKFAALASRQADRQPDA